MVDAVIPGKVVQGLIALGAAKTRLSPMELLVRSMLAGAFLGVATTLAFTAAGQTGLPIVGAPGQGIRSFRVGYTVGGGVEYAFTPNWSVKAEYLYVDLRQNNNNNFFFVNNNVRNDFHIARVGLNYKFGSY